MRRAVGVWIVAVVLTAGAGAAEAKDWNVAPGGTGSGTAASPFGRIQDGIDAAQPGDTVLIAAGTYSERLTTARNGVAGAPITIRASGAARSVLVTASGRVLTVSHAHIAVDGLVLDGQYGTDDTVRVTSNGDFFHLKNTEVRRTTNDLVDIGAPEGVLIEGSLIHHALNAANGRTDAHGIAAGAVRDLVVRDTEIHTFSGDGLQVDPGRSSPGWSGVTIERARIWLAPLPAAENGFAAGALTGENAVDTKASSALPRATLVIRDTVASGFGSPTTGGSNWAAFNLKENVDVVVDRVTVYDSEIAFRLRGATTGGAWVNVRNAVVHNVLTAFRYEDNIQNLRIWNSTVGQNVTRVFQAANSSSGGLDVRNLLVLGTTLPKEASGSSNLAVGNGAFADVTAQNYALAAGAAAIDAGVSIPEVTIDRAGVTRPQGASYDVGAYEWTGRANVPPAVTMTSPADGSALVAPATMTLSADASDADGAVVDVTFYANGELVERDTTPPYSVARVDIAAGVYTLHAVAADDQGATTQSAAVVLTVEDEAGTDLALSTHGYKVKKGSKVDLTWSPAGSGRVDVYRNGAIVLSTAHDGRYTDSLRGVSSGIYRYKVCVAGSATDCSNETEVVF